MSFTILFRALVPFQKIVQKTSYTEAELLKIDGSKTLQKHS